MRSPQSSVLSFSVDCGLLAADLFVLPPPLTRLSDAPRTGAADVHGEAIRTYVTRTRLDAPLHVAEREGGLRGDVRTSISGVRPAHGLDLEAAEAATAIPAKLAARDVLAKPRLEPSDAGEDVLLAWIFSSCSDALRQVPSKLEVERASKDRKSVV